jgi:hypothetical protein
VDNAAGSTAAQIVGLDRLVKLCGGGECPTVYQTDRGTLVIQGYLFDPAQAGTTVPAGEQMVEVPAELLAQYVREGHSGVPGR